MASEYAYQVMCRIEFRNSDTKPRWYTIGQYNERWRAVERAESFCYYLQEMRADEAPRSKPHSLMAVFEIRGPDGSWTQCRNVVPKGVNIFAQMSNQKVKAGARARPKAKPKQLPPAGLVVVQLEERSPGWKGVVIVSQHRDQAVAMRRAAAALSNAVRSIKPEKGRKLRATVRTLGGKLLAETGWVAA